MKLTRDRLVTLFGLLVIFGIVLTVVWFGFLYPSTPARGQPYPGPGAITGKPITPTPLSPRLSAASVPTSTQDYLPVIAYFPPPCFTSPDGIGLERYYTYQSFRLSDRLNVLVNLWNGNLVAQFDEFGIPSRGLPLAFNHTYNDCANLVSPSSGMNWTTNLAARVISSTGQAILYDGDGTKLSFASNGSGGWNAPTGIFDTLTGTGPFTVTHKDQSQDIFTQTVGTTWYLSRKQDRFGNALSLSYDGSNRLSQVTSAGGQVLTLTYNASSQLSQITNDAGQAFTFQYNGVLLTGITDPLSQTTLFTYTGTNLATIADPRGVQTVFDYDEYQRLKTISISTTQVATFTYGAGVTTFADGNNHPTTFYLNSTGQVTQTVRVLDSSTFYTSTFFYDGGYNVITTTDPLGRSTYAQYDGKGNVLSQTNALTRTAIYSYTAQNDLLYVIDAASHTTSYGYDSYANLQFITDALTNTTRFTSTTQGQRVAVEDAERHVTRYGYSTAGYLITTTDALNNLTQYAYDTLGNRLAVTDALTNVTFYRYDAANRLISTTIPLTVGVSATTLYGYDPVGNRTSVIDANTLTTTFTYDPLNRLTLTTDALGQTTQTQYDPVGNRTKVIDANTHPVTYTYDTLNRLTTITDSMSHTISYGYDAVGNRIRTTDARQNATFYRFDKLNRVISTTIPLTGTETATSLFDYDLVGNRTLVTDALTHTTTYVYDWLNRVQNVIDAATHPITYTHDKVGNRIGVSDTLGNGTRYGYDPLNRVVTITNPALKSQYYGYDAVGNRTVFTDELTQVSHFSYDAAHRLVAATDPSLQTTYYGYDKIGNLITLTNPATITTRYAYDNVYRVISQTNTQGTFRYDYDKIGNVLTYTHPTNAQSLFSYDSANRLTLQDDRDPSNASVVSYTFAYDENSNRTRQVESRPGNRTYTTTNAYNKANWLVASTDPTNGATTYDYDAVGNQKGVTDPLGVSTAITYNQVNLPYQTRHTQNSVLQDTTTNSFDPRNDLIGQMTVATSVTLSTTATYNPNNYLSYVNNLETSPQSLSRDYTSSYFDNNLLYKVVPGYYSTPGDPNPNYEVIYDSANRVNCWQNGAGSYMYLWQYYPDGKRQYEFGKLLEVNFFGAQQDCVPWLTNPYYFLNIRDVYTYTGNFLTQRETHNFSSQSYSTDISVKNRSVFSYTNNNLTSEVRVDGLDTSTPTTTTLSYNWSWQASAYRLTTFTNTSGITTAFDYDLQGRIARRFTAQGYSEYIYEDGTDWLSREFWHPISRTITGTFDLVRYWYTNGRPSRMELADVGTDGQTLNGYTTYYIKFNWHGDATAFVDGSNGNGGDGWYAYDPWGNAAPPPWPLPNWKTWDHYHWNGGWGYLFFQDLGMYYVHGRWYRPDLGLFISPDAKGEYLYGSGQDAVNQAWAFLQDLSNQSGEIEEDISDLADEARDYSLGAGYQFVNDQTFQLPNIIFGTEWQRRQTYTFYWGQQGGRTASDWVGKALLVKGGYDIAVGLTVIPPTAATGALCTAGTSGVCAIPTGAGLAIETSMVLVGVTESAYAGGVLYFANQNPVSYSGSGELSVNSKGEPYPDVNVPGYGKVPIPSGPFEKVGQFQRDSLRNEFRNKTRNAFVKWWIEQGLPLPSGRFEVHHIQPLEWGGTNDFSNLVILPYEVHRRIFNPWWQFFRP